MKILATCALSLMLLTMAVPSFAQITTQDADALPAKADNNKHAAPKKDKEKIGKLSNFYIGGIPGFGINSYFVNVDVALEAGYFVHPHIALGMQTTYSYVLDKYYNISYNVVRVGPYMRGYVWKGIFAQAEYQLTSIRNYKDHSDPNNVVNIPVLNNNSILLGAGYHENFQHGVGFYFSVLFNVLNSSNSLAANPDFKVGLTYRFKDHYAKKGKAGKGTSAPPVFGEDEE